MLFNLIILLINVFCVSLTLGHLCLWQPMQRGNFSLDPPGSHDCYRKFSPCGGLNSSMSKDRTILEAGTNYTVRFQQHINHYYPANPGQLEISFAVGIDPEEEDFRSLISFDDYNPMNHNTQTNFSISLQLPDQPCDYCVLRVKYLTNNPDEEDHGTTFYQCSDIQLKESIPKINYSIVQSIRPMKHTNDPHDCCAPLSFKTLFIHRIPEIDYISSGMIYYDQPSKQMRISLFSMGIEYNMWMNFTSGKQYYYNEKEKSCHLFGLNYWNDWCYGNTFNQSEDFNQGNISCSNDFSQSCNQWNNGDFFFQSTVNHCYPVALNRASTDEQTIYFNPQNGPFSPEVFQPNSICLKQTKITHSFQH